MGATFKREAQRAEACGCNVRVRSIAPHPSTGLGRSAPLTRP